MVEGLHKVLELSGDPELRSLESPKAVHYSLIFLKHLLPGGVSGAKSSRDVPILEIAILKGSTHPCGIMGFPLEVDTSLWNYEIFPWKECNLVPHATVSEVTGVHYGKCTLAHIEV